MHPLNFPDAFSLKFSTYICVSTKTSISTQNLLTIFANVIFLFLIREIKGHICSFGLVCRYIKLRVWSLLISQIVQWHLQMRGSNLVCKVRVYPLLVCFIACLYSYTAGVTLAHLLRACIPAETFVHELAHIQELAELKLMIVWLNVH